MSKLAQVVLLSPPSRSNNHYRPPVALLYLAGYLNKNKIKTDIIDINLSQTFRSNNFQKNLSCINKKTEKKIISKLKKQSPKIIGITCYTPEFMEVVGLAKKIRLIHPNTKIVIGGIHPTFYPQDFFPKYNSIFDFLVIGEGELTFLKLCQNILSKKNNFKFIKGIAYYDKKEHRLIRTPFRPVTHDLDSISYPDYSLINMNYYSTANPYAIRGCFFRSAYILATRGCPSQCTFCVSKKLRQYSGGGIYTRMRSAKSLIDEINLLYKKYKIDSFYFIDDLFTVNKDNVKKFCDLLIKNHLNIPWACSSKVSTLDDKTLKLMAKSGCVQIDFGVERGSNQALNQLKKGISIEMIKNIFNLCHKYNIRTFANFLVNIPNESKKDLNDIVRLIEYITPDVISINIFIPYPGTEIYDNMTYKFKPEEYFDLFYANQLIYKQPHKYKFHSHNIDILKWTDKHSRKYNKIWPAIKFHLSPIYIKSIFKSRQKTDYLKQIKNLFLELLSQKYNIK